MKKIIKVFLLTIFIVNIAFVNALADENHEKTIVECHKKFEVLDQIKSVREIWDYAYHNDKYVLPEEVEVKLIDEEKVNVPVIWEKEAVTDETGVFVYRGKVKDIDKKVTLRLFVIPKVTSVKNIDINMYVGDEYCLPEKVKVQYSDGTDGMEKVNWADNNLDIKTVGEYACKGEIEGYDGEVKADITVKSNFLLERTSPKQNEKNVELKFGYMSLIFSKDTVKSYEVNKIILKDENDVRIRIKRIVPGVTCKDYLLIIPNRPLDNKMEYTLFVPKGIIKSIDGEVYEEDIEVTFTMK